MTKAAQTRAASAENPTPYAPHAASDLSVPDLSALSNLKEKNLAALGLMILEGRIVIEKALETGVVPRFLVCTEAEAEYWRARRGGAAFPLHILTHAELCALVDFKFHRGAIAVADMPRIEAFAVTSGSPTISSGAQSDGASRQTFFLCLWDVTDPSNLGALVRTAAGLGADGVLLGPGCANPYYRKTIRASMGNVFSLPLWSIDIEGLAALAHGGARGGTRLIAAALTENAVPAPKIAATFAATAGSVAPLTLVLGNEGYGLPAEVLALCSDRVCIPMARGVDSLNVAVAGGILMHELLRCATL